MRDLSSLRSFLCLQALLVLFVAPVIFCFYGYPKLSWVLSGFSVNFLGQLIFALLLFGLAGARFARAILAFACIGEIAKVVFFMFFLKFFFLAFGPDAALFVVCGFVGAQASFVFILFNARFRRHDVTSRA